MQKEEYIRNGKSSCVLIRQRHVSSTMKARQSTLFKIRCDWIMPGSLHVQLTIKENESSILS